MISFSTLLQARFLWRINDLSKIISLETYLLK